MGSFETIIYEKNDGIAYITLNRPQVLNAYNIKMRDELYEVLGAIKADTEIGVVIIKGAPGRRVRQIGPARMPGLRRGGRQGRGFRKVQLPGLRRDKPSAGASATCFQAIAG